MPKQFSGGLFAAAKPKALTPSEANVSKSIEGFLNARKIYNDRLNSGKVEVKKKFYDQKSKKWKEFSNWIQLCQKGTPDRFAILPKKYDPRGIGGLLLFIEVKALNGKLSPDQFALHKVLRQQGALVLVVRSLSELENCFRDFEKLSLENQKYIGFLYDVSSYGIANKE